MERRSVSNRGCLVVILLILLGTFTLGSIFTIIVDGHCASGGSNWLPSYPDAQVVEQDYTFLRMWGIGESYRVLSTPDDINTVRQWYQRSDRRNSADYKGRGGAYLDWSVDEAENGGTTITLYSECAKTLDLSPFGISTS